MVTLFGRHPVADYKAWRKVFDEFYPTRKRVGVIREVVYRSADDPNDITMLFDFATIEEARAFPNNDELRAAMHMAGSIGAPTIWFAMKA
ncbi:MAG: cyclase [Hyphomicrobium sp.]|jgi:hypothetical protein|nr:cyclase [Hyphomicrobium sp.]